MKTSSAKAKGRNLQNWVRDLLVDVVDISPEYIRPALMGETGADIKIIGAAAKALIPYSIECKNQEGFGKVYTAYEQAEGHGEGQPLLIIKSNRKKPLAIVDAEWFIRKSSE